jgi:hypothetical protein
MYFIYADLIRHIEKCDKSKLRDYYINIREFYKKESPKQLEVPPFDVIARVLLSLSRQDSEKVVFVNE